MKFIGKIIKSLLVWRLLILAVAAIAVYLLPAKDCCQTFGANLSPAYLANIWANFAGHDFLDLARFGYGYPLKPSTYVFFPLFPAAIKLLTTIIPNYLTSGLVLVHLSLILALYYLYHLVRLDYKDAIAKNTLLLLLLFPTAFFLGLLASATSFAGIFLWPALAIEMWQKARRSPSLAWLILPPLGLLAYMKHLILKTGDPFMFLK